MSNKIQLYQNDLPDDLKLGNTIAVDGEFMVVEAIVDGGEVIDERNESNNAMETSLTLTQPEVTESEDVSSGLSTTTVYVGSVIVLILILAGFRLLAPPKIRKYE